MAQITTGLTNGGVTTHYNFSYDSSYGGAGGVEPARTNAVIAACENDYNTFLSGPFGAANNASGMNVQVTTQAGNTCGPGGTPQKYVASENWFRPHIL
jgi:hypothetical protein